jgi:hypothetical protein
MRGHGNSWALALLAAVGACVVPPADRQLAQTGVDGPVAPVAADVAVALARIESRLGRGEVHDAMADLAALHVRAPDDVRVRGRLGRLLHQRALGRYGGGAVAAAIADWEHVLRLAPDHASARELLASARAEVR